MMYKVNHQVDECLSDMLLVDMRCKHALRTSDRGREVIRLSSLIGYEIAEWGLHVNRTDLAYHTNVIMKMEEDGYEHPERIVICRYDFTNEPCIWLDNLHSAVMYVRKYGSGVRLKDIPFYVVDLSGTVPVLYENGALKNDDSCIKGAVKKARRRQERSNLKELIDFNYTFKEFLTDNLNLLTCTKYYGAAKGAMKQKVF